MLFSLKLFVLVVLLFHYYRMKNLMTMIFTLEILIHLNLQLIIILTSFQKKLKKLWILMMKNVKKYLSIATILEKINLLCRDVSGQTKLMLQRMNIKLVIGELWKKRNLTLLIQDCECLFEVMALLAKMLTHTQVHHIEQI